jgi:hypothetical protein
MVPSNMPRPPPFKSFPIKSFTTRRCINYVVEKASLNNQRINQLIVEEEEEEEEEEGKKEDGN